MTRLLISFFFLTFAFGCIGLTGSNAQNSQVPSGWIKVSACKISFSIPKNLKNQNAEGIDSCIAVFSNCKMSLAIDYGWYGGAYAKYDTSLEFKEETIEIDGKKATLATYIDDSKWARNNPNRKYVAGVYVNLNDPQDKDVGMIVSLNMKVEAQSGKELEIAKQIFQTIRFDK